jgi:hypothetical protein
MAGPSNGADGGMFTPALPAQPGSSPAVPAAWPARQTVQFYRTTTVDQVPDPLVEGEPAVEISDDYTKLWLGDGTVNRLLLSSKPGDSPFFPTAGGPFLPLVGGVLSGGLTITAGDLIVGTGALVVGSGSIDLAGVTVSAGGGWLSTNGNFSAASLNSAGAGYIATSLQIDTAQLAVNGVGQLASNLGLRAPFFVADNYVDIGPHRLIDTAGALSVAGMFQSDSLDIVNNATIGGRVYINTYPPVAVTEAVTKQYVDALVDSITVDGGVYT